MRTAADIYDAPAELSGAIAPGTHRSEADLYGHEAATPFLDSIEALAAEILVEEPVERTTPEPEVAADDMIERGKLRDLLQHVSLQEDIVDRAMRGETSSLQDGVRFYGVQNGQNVETVVSRIRENVEAGVLYPHATPAERKSFAAAIGMTEKRKRYL